VPARSRRRLRSLALSSASPFTSTGFIFVGGSPATYAINADFPAPKAAATIAGPRKLTLTCSGFAMPGDVVLTRDETRR
jgi:hypothetical protein